MRIQVVNWQHTFENNKSRERDKCSFVCVPNKMGMGLAAMLSEPDGAAIYGVFCLLLGLLSRQTKPRDGHLTDTGRAEGRHLTGTELALLWRRPVSEIERCFGFICSPNIGWAIDLDQKCPPSARVVPAECPPSAIEGRKEGIEEKRKKEPPPAVKKTSSMPPGFIQFWNAWPKTTRKVGRGLCLKFWHANGCEDLAPAIAAALQRFKACEDWAKNGGQFIPGPLVWLRAQAWEAPIEAFAGNQPTDPPMTPEMWEEAERCRQEWAKLKAQSAEKAVA